MKQPQFIKRLAAVSAILTYAFSAQAQIQKEKDWTLEKRAEAILSAEACVASTNVAQSKVSVKTEFLAPVTDETGPLIVLKVRGLGGKVAKAYVRPDAKTQYPMLLLSSDVATGEDIFVLSPMRLPETMQIIGQKATLDVYFGEGPTAILARISLRGSSVIMTKTAACRDSKVLLRELLFNELKKDANLAIAQPGTVHDMMASYQETVRLLNARVADQTTLTNHQNAGAGILAQEKSAANALKTAAQREQDTLTAINNLKVRISDLQDRIQRAHEELPGLQNSRAAAVIAVTDAEQALAPHIPRVDRLSSEVSNSRSEERRLEKNISNVQSEISSLQTQMQQLENESFNSRRQQESLDREIQEINRRLSQAESDYRNYDERRETERILSNDSNYQNTRREVERLERSQRDLQFQVETARSDVNSTKRAYDQCLALLPPPGGGGKPPPGTGGPLPPNPDPGPRPGEPGAAKTWASDCTGEFARLKEAERNFEQKRSDLEQTQRRLSIAQSDLRRMENDAAREARDNKEDLRREIDRLTSDQRLKRDQISRLDSRIREIQQIELPRKQRELDSARNSLSNSQSQLSTAQQNTRRAQNELDQYKRSVGYDQLVANVNSTRSHLNGLDNAIANAQDMITNGPARVAQAQNEQKAQEQELIQRQSVRVQAETNLAQASQAANAHRTEESRLAEILRLTQEDFTASKQMTQGLSKALYGF
ncbi:MAG: hypothetical protein V4654_08265 [Bdellovibrionota bacterium]